MSPQSAWKEDSGSVVVLPSGEWGAALLDCAEEWTAAWLLAPAFWVMSDDLLVSSPEGDASDLLHQALAERRPPRLRAFVLGRDEQGKAARQEVELFWALGTREFRLLRLVALRVDQPEVEQARTATAATLARRYLDFARPLPLERGQGRPDGTEFLTLNVVVSKTLASGADTELLEPDWSANIIAAPEDSPTPLSTDAFVDDEERYLGFALTHLATAAGIWAGLPKSSYELEEIYPHPGSARFQRVFVRAVATDTLALDLALTALKSAANSSRLMSLSSDATNRVAAVANHRIDVVRSELVEHMLRGPGSARDSELTGFLYRRLEQRQSETEQVSFWRVMLLRLKDGIEALWYLPRWLRYLSQRRMLKSTGDASAHLLDQALPKRLFAKFDASGLPDPTSETLPSLRPHPELWAHVRGALMAAVDAPNPDRTPEPLKANDGSRMFFSSLSDVLPDPEAIWWSEKHVGKTATVLEPIPWLGVAEYADQVQRLLDRQAVLQPSIGEARAASNQDKTFFAEMQSREHELLLEVQHAQREFDADYQYALRMRAEHPHGLSIAQAGNPRKPPKTGNPIRVPIDTDEPLADPPIDAADGGGAHEEGCACDCCVSESTVSK